MSYFEEQLNADQGANKLRQLTDSIYVWMEDNHYLSPQIAERFDHIRSTIDDPHRNILFIAEFSRGKSELINTTIFGNLGEGARYLPSSPGHTTRCTTVLQYDDSELPSIRLLPTRTEGNIQSQTLSMLEGHPAWQQSFFSLDDRAAIKKALKQISEVELSPPEEAVALGFIKDTSPRSLADIGLIKDQVQIPKWRHAVVNYPHPLLKQGLRIIDTPGLNVLGVEPELTLQAIDSAHAVVFILSADTGITRSELKMWRDHIQQVGTDNVVVVLNKIDLLWDELKSRSEIDLDIKKQIRDVARILNIPPSRVFPVSAQKALVARTRDSSTLLKSSGILKYEQALADTINYSSQQRIANKAIKVLSPSLDGICNRLKRRINDAFTHIHDLNSLHENQTTVARSGIEKVKRDIERHSKARRHMVEIKKELNEGYANFVRRLDVVFLDRMIASYRYEISSQLTTSGLQREMNDFQSVAENRFRLALSYIILLERNIFRNYRKIEQLFGITGLTPRKIGAESFIESFSQIQINHKKHSTGLGMVMTEQHVLRDRYYTAVMIKIRSLYQQTREEVDHWCRTVLIPLELELKERANEIKRRKASLDRIKSKDSKALDEITALTAQSEEDRHQLAALEGFIRRISQKVGKTPKLPKNVVDIHRHNQSSAAN